MCKDRINKWENISQKIKIIPEDLGKSKSVIIKKIIIESIIGFRENEVINVKSIIKDVAGNETEGAPSKNKIIIDQTPQYFKDDNRIKQRISF